MDIFIRRLYAEHSLKVKSCLETDSIESHQRSNSATSSFKRSPLNALLSKEGACDDVNGNYIGLVNEKEIICEYSNMSNKNEMIRVKPNVADTTQSTNAKKQYKKTRKSLSNKKANQTQVEFEPDFLLKSVTSLHSSDTNGDNSCVMSIVVLNNESNDQEQEIVIKRQRQILTNAFGLELTKEDIDSLENSSLPNANVLLTFLSDKS